MIDWIAENWVLASLVAVVAIVWIAGTIVCDDSMEGY